MVTFSWLMLFWTVAMVTGGPPSEPAVTLESLQEEAQILANTVVGIIDEVNEAIPAYLSAATALNAAADEVENLVNIKEQIAEIKTSARNLPDTDRAERLATVGRIQELLGAVQEAHNKVKVIEYRTAERVGDPISEAVQILEAQKEVIGVSVPFVPEFYLETTRYTWLEAQANCESRGMGLVSLTTAEIEQTVETMLSDNGLQIAYWTSGLLVDGQYVWTAMDNTLVDDGYTNFPPDYPRPLSPPGEVLGHCIETTTVMWCAISAPLDRGTLFPSFCQTYPEN